MPTCDAESAGFTCMREAGHGDLHVDPRYAAKPACHIWIHEPMNEAEARGLWPMTGYRLLTDNAMRDGHQ
jgi:hypothetical protein